LAIGVKEQLGPTPGGFDVSATLFLSFPTGADTVPSGGYERGGSRQLLHFGTELRIGRRQQQQVDFHFGVGLTAAAVDHFIGIGYSFRFQAIHRK